MKKIIIELCSAPGQLSCDDRPNRMPMQRIELQRNVHMLVPVVLHKIMVKRKALLSARSCFVAPKERLKFSLKHDD